VEAQRKTRHGDVEKQEWFGRLIGQGVSNRQACRIVGINRRTGTRWRGVSFHLCKSGVVHHRIAVGADRRSVL